MPAAAVDPAARGRRQSGRKGRHRGRRAPDPCRNTTHPQEPRRHKFRLTEGRLKNTFARRSFAETGATVVSTLLVARQVLGQNLGVSLPKDNLDAVLRGIVERGDVPGVVAAVTSPAETIYLAAFGERGLGRACP